MAQVTAFASIRHALPSCALRPIAGDDEAAALGAMLAAIDPWRLLGYAPAAMARALTRPDPALARFAIEVDGAAVGVVCVRHPWLRGPYLETIGLDPAHQGRGLGAEVMGWLEGEARAVAGNLWLLVTEVNVGARRFYARRGFVEIAPLPDLVRPGVAEILMRKVLA